MEEFPIFPPSVTETDPSVPAFIGYTEKAKEEVDDDLLGIPRSISSLLEYEHYFGKSVQQFFLLYYALQSYFSNGGGRCFIICVGKDSNSISKQDFINGLDAADRVNEVSLILFPEATQLPGLELYEVQREALSRSARLRNRFCIFDLKPATDTQSHSAVVNEFRENIGTANLIYGAAYTPHLIVSTGTGDITLPPSAAAAGNYYRTDKTRGVWKAPANVSVTSVKGLLYMISNSEQDTLNVDVNRGISVNAIRFFTGKGFLIWGARTLAGNDNEWRYIPVRRFFMMVEESVKRSTAWAVFEPNDANTWTKIKAMTGNYLVQQWRAGALAGAKPEDAFYVKAGLGETMTFQDILEGKLIAEIGMAVIRPAEFIIIRFSHKRATN